MLFYTKPWNYYINVNNLSTLMIITNYPINANNLNPIQLQKNQLKFTAKNQPKAKKKKNRYKNKRNNANNTKARLRLLTNLNNLWNKAVLRQFSSDCYFACERSL